MLKKRGLRLYTLDNLFRMGSKLNLNELLKNITNFKTDISNYKSFEPTKFDLIIDCCTEASVEASKSLREGKKFSIQT